MPDFSLSISYKAINFLNGLNRVFLLQDRRFITVNLIGVKNTR